MISKEKLREARERLARSEAVTLPAEFDGVEAVVKALTVGDMALAHRMIGPTEGEAKADNEKFGLVVTFLSLRDAEGNRLFPDDGLDDFVALPALVVGPIVSAAMRVNGLSADEGKA